VIAGRVPTCCPTCGPVDVRGADITVLSRVDLLQNVYPFECPTCSASVVRRASPSVVTLLLRAGAQVERWPRPLPLYGRPDPWLAPFNNDDLIAFREQLEQLPTADPHMPTVGPVIAHRDIVRVRRLVARRYRPHTVEARSMMPVVVFLASESARWVTGQTIVANGGRTML
jgi:hypothetical protein